MTEFMKLVSAIEQAGSASPFRLRQGVIKTVAADMTVTVTIGGSDTLITGVKIASHVCPVADTTCWLATDGRDWFVLDTLAPNGPAYASMRKSTAQTIATATWTELTWGSRTEAVTRGFILGSTGLTVQVPGIYSVTASIAYDANSTGNRHAQLLHNGVVEFQGTSTVATPSHIARVRADGILTCVAGDVINVQTYQSSGAGLTTDVASGSNKITAVWLGSIA